MRIPFIALLTTAILSSAAIAAPTTPQGARRPPPYAQYRTMSADSTLPADTNADTDAKTLQGINGRHPVRPDTQRLDDARVHFMELNKQLGEDVRNHASKETIDQDRAAIAEAKKQLDAARPAPVK